METTKFTRKPFDIEAVQVTSENMEEVASWSHGLIEEDPGENGKFYIHIKVEHPITARQEKAYIGDWVLSSKKGFKIYTPGAFQKNFVLADPSDQAVVDLKNIFDETVAHVGTSVNPKDAISGKR